MLRRTNFSMLPHLHFPPMHANTHRPPKIALALAGRWAAGAIYEIGAMCALEESLDGLDFTKLDHYVGVSAGGFIVARWPTAWRRANCALPS